MKRICSILLLLTLVMVHANAQNDFSIGVFFDERSSYAQDAKMVWVEGSALKTYHLTLYRSISTENRQTIKEMEQAVLKDSKKAADKEIGYVGPHLYYSFLSFQPSKAGSTTRRFIFYRNASLKSNGKKDATLVYLEGKVSMEELKKLFE